MGSSIASGWRELSGENNWEGLLQPLDPDLRSYIIHYCQMAGAIGDHLSRKIKESDAFKQEFFSEACLVKGNPYKRDILVSWRGTQAVMEWISNVNIEKRSASDIFPIAGKDDDVVHDVVRELVNNPRIGIAKLRTAVDTFVFSVS
ncbi:hypothetical protein V6N12_034081 [Hibiscus sabdariffa]|uniref:Phospholipase A1 n=1 Tax=Hibiscus sabdariffa TaxID=183260 RepID=A0ABR2BGR0_9ROSI